ncbi:OmpA family protein [Parahaliea aestuarii]|uniref:OmpA family protein n=1 Tax=Parahaliea aestuarii TaxID=1852021 RepID=A0A5C8ZMQ0_9GAMM|nr:OmpA family protein [Parahaliea aestuarii]TXS89763.1 OmpA family protein [Parahaliea aestuarii]
MKKRILSLAAGAALASVLAVPASADVPITINGGIGQWYFDRDRDIDDTATPWVSLEYAFDDNWAAEIFYAEDESNTNGVDIDVATWQLDMLYYGGSYIGGGNRVRPYLAFGGGEIDFEADNGIDSVETVLNAGAGVRYMLTSRFGARLEARLVHSLDESHNDVLLTAGLNYYFGKVKEDSPPPPPPAPVDSDGDGVTDDKDQCPGTPPGTRVDANGCPLPVERVASIKLKVNFDFDSSKVKEQYFNDIGELANFLKRFDDVDVQLEGHTDSVGPDDYNQKLSQRRADAVKDMLVNQYGIAASRIKPVGYGEAQPVATNDTKEGRAQNRRTMATLEVTYEE